MSAPTKRGHWTDYQGASLHEGVRRDAARWRQRNPGVPAPGFFFLPGTVFTNGTHMFEVVYGYQSLAPNDSGWVTGVRTDFIDGNDTELSDRYCYSLFSWQGAGRDGQVITGQSILSFVRAAPQLN